MRRLARHLVVMIVASSVLVGVAAPPAAANSAVGLANNAWLVTELATEVAGAYQTPAAQYASAAELAAASTATVATTKAPGFTTKPPVSSKLGLVVNGIAVLGTMAAVWNPLDDDAPEVPAGPGASTYGGSPSCGWGIGSAFVSMGSCSSTSTPVNIDITKFPVEGSRRSFCLRTSVNGVTTAWTGVAQSTSVINLSKDSNFTKYLDVVPRTPNVSAPSGCGTSNYVTAMVPKVGGTLPDPSVSGDPAVTPRYIDTTITCRSAAGGSQIFTQSTGPFTFNPAVESTLPEVPSMDCPAGTWLDSGGREIRTDGSTTKVPLETYNAPSWVETQATRFPECFPVGTNPCELHVKIVRADETERECTNYTPGADHPCYKWLRDVDRATKFRCYFGDYLIGLRACRALKEAYSPSPTITPSEPVDPLNPDPDDPETPGDPEVPISDPTPETTPDLNSDGCIPTGWEILNPFSMFKATGCALKWAFVPKTSLATRLATIKGDLQTRIPFSYMAPLATLVAPAIGSGCPNWTITVGSYSDNWICGQAFTDLVRAARPVMLGFMGLLALWPLVRSIAYASFPIIKPQPGGLR